MASVTDQAVKSRRLESAINPPKIQVVGGWSWGHGL